MAVVLPLHAASGVPLDGPRGGTASNLLDLRLAEAKDCVEKLKDECARLDALVASKSIADPKKDVGPPATFASIVPRTSSSMKEQASPSGAVSRELPTWPLSAVAASMHHTLPRVGGSPRIAAKMLSGLGHARKMRNEGGEGGCELCARNGNGYEGKASNQRFLCTFNIRLMEALPDFLEEDMVQLHEGFTDSYLGEEELRKVIDRAAHLQVGLTGATDRYRETFRQVVSAGDARFPAFVATLPRFLQDYCQQLKSDAAPERAA